MSQALADEAADLRRRITGRLVYDVGKEAGTATERDWFIATALVTRDRIVDLWLAANRRVREERRKHVYYLSLEFLTGRLLFDAIGNLGMTEAVRMALAGLGVELDALRIQESDPGLGNGGLGRLAACFMESMATVGVAAMGYGIRYEHGLFRQVIFDGSQRELPEDWLSSGNPWEFERPAVTYDVGFGGWVALVNGGDGRPVHLWHPAETVSAVAYDMPVVGWRGEQINTLRLWSARAKDPMRLEDFNRGDHIGALSDRMRVEAISRVLYPSDDTAAGQELRLRQEFFFASASLQDMLRRHIERGDALATLPEMTAIQINDTHPAIGIVELMRLLIDVHGLEWDDAWRITCRCFSYTNHTLLPEALETWPVPLMERLLPRHMQLIYLINVRHLDWARVSARSDEFVAAASLIDERHGRRVRMGTLAFLGSHKVNGVSALHTGLMRRSVFHDLDRLYPYRIVNKTNGISFRRWLHYSNPGLTALIVETLGERALGEPETMQELERYAGDTCFTERFTHQRQQAKRALAAHVAALLGIQLDPHALFDVQIKRIHEYKRQLLNVLQTVALYETMRARPNNGWVPRVKILAGKAAAGYHNAKLIIRLAHDVAKVINSDPAVQDLLKVVFIPNYNVSMAELIVPAADLSEQISTAGMEASGTGNMKLALNGALTIGTLDGANVEIRERVHPEHIFIFGLTAEEVEARQNGGRPPPAPLPPLLAEVLDAVASGVFSPDEPDRYRGLIGALLERDRFMVLADFAAYDTAQHQVDERWRDQRAWWRSSVINTARVGWFSSDRAIREYAAEIWNVPVQSAA
ncbi:MAG: glycogen/starch/alpha-glucan phosphorylase [Acidisphaera sp.]|nr:glycogen/starch/alpha-glucan phosphorylase [Acidisphaera sp.]